MNQAQIQNTCGKVKSDLWNRFELQNAIIHFFGSPCRLKRYMHKIASLQYFSKNYFRGKSVYQEYFKARKVRADIWHLSSVFVKNLSTHIPSSNKYFPKKFTNTFPRKVVADIWHLSQKCKHKTL